MHISSTAPAIPRTVGRVVICVDFNQLYSETTSSLFHRVAQFDCCVSGSLWMRAQVHSSRHVHKERYRLKPSHCMSFTHDAQYNMEYLKKSYHQHCYMTVKECILVCPQLMICAILNVSTIQTNSYINDFFSEINILIYIIRIAESFNSLYFLRCCTPSPQLKYIFLCHTFF